MPAMETGMQRTRPRPGDAVPDIAVETMVPCGMAVLPATWTVPDGARAIVVFAHGSGSGRASPRNRFVADALGAAGIATLLVDMVLPSESAHAQGMDAVELGERLLGAVRWSATHALECGLPTGVFGSSTGAAAALIAAAQPGSPIRAVVSRGGRTDLAMPWLGRVHAPTLLIVGGADPWVRRANQEAMASLAGDKELVVIPGAGHLFEQPGAMERVAALAASWFQQHLMFVPKPPADA